MPVFGQFTIRLFQNKNLNSSARALYVRKALSFVSKCVGKWFRVTVILLILLWGNGDVSSSLNVLLNCDKISIGSISGKIDCGFYA